MMAFTKIPIGELPRLLCYLRLSPQEARKKLLDDAVELMMRAEQKGKLNTSMSRWNEFNLKRCLEDFDATHPPVWNKNKWVDVHVDLGPFQEPLL